MVRLILAAPGKNQATGIIPQPDAEHAPDVWRSVATEFSGDHAVLFDLYNEPHDVSWECWEEGCEANDKHFGEYPAVGMRQLVEVVRSTGARQPLMLGGLNWASDPRGWLAHPVVTGELGEGTAATTTSTPICAGPTGTGSPTSAGAGSSHRA